MARKHEDEDDLVGGVHGGHNAQTVAADQLKSIIARIERLNEDKAAISDDIKDLYAEAKGNGFDTKAIRKLIAERKQDADERTEFESILDLYRHALGMI